MNDQSLPKRMGRPIRKSGEPATNDKILDAAILLFSERGYEGTSMKQIPIALQSHLREYATTWCYLMRIACVGKWSGVVRGFTSLDESVDYDDGQGRLLYRSDNGFMPAKFQQSADFSVDNTEVTGWVTDDDISEADILAGMFA